MAFEDERAEGRAIVRVHILDPAALATSSQALMSFWPDGDVRAGHVTSLKEELIAKNKLKIIQQILSAIAYSTEF